MVFQNQFSAITTAALILLHLSTAPCRATDRNRPFDSGQPPELINQPVCWFAEEPDPSRYCDFAQRN
jgi:hypothetical protein